MFLSRSCLSSDIFLVFCWDCSISGFWFCWLTSFLCLICLIVFAICSGVKFFIFTAASSGFGYSVFVCFLTVFLISSISASVSLFLFILSRQTFSSLFASVYALCLLTFFLQLSSVRFVLLYFQFIYCFIKERHNLFMLLTCPFYYFLFLFLLRWWWIQRAKIRFSPVFQTTWIFKRGVCWNSILFDPSPVLSWEMLRWFTCWKTDAVRFFASSFHFGIYFCVFSSPPTSIFYRNTITR